MRRTEKLTIPGVRSEAHGERDNGKTFILTEMDAYRGQDWALRALLALAASGATLPAGAMTGGWAGLAGFGVTALLRAPYAELRPLLDEMLDQAKYEHKPGQPPQGLRPDAAGNCPVQEIKTFLTIQVALFKLHTGFSPADAPPNTEQP
jgi:hypothetical protein